MSSEVRSFFDTKVQKYDHIWEQLNQNQYQEDFIEYEGECERVSRNKQQLKKIEIAIGQETLYAFKKKHYVGQLSLTVAIIVFKQYQGEEVIRINKNEHYVDLLISDNEILKKILISKCIQTTFHNDFRVIKMIGKGSFANVYLAQKHSNGNQYAIKAFSKLYVQGQYKGKEGLENEIRVMRRLKQQNILHLHEVYETTNSIYFVLDLLEGGELLKRAQTTMFSTQNIQKLTYNLLKAIYHMHQKKCIHRDLKPENLLLKSNQNNVDIVIADFGLAHILETDPLYKRCGTPGFVAPEVLQYQDNSPFYDGRCDVFSLGIIFYLLVTGIHPFGFGDHKTVLTANKNCQINFDIKQLKKCSPTLLHLLQQMLKINPTERLTAEECLKHAYFQEIFNENDLLENTEDLQTYFNLNKLKKQDDVTQIGSYEVLTKQQQWNGQIDTVGSLSNCSNQSTNKFDKQQSNLSKFSQFCQQMKQDNLSGSPTQQVRRKDNQNLHKFALQNSYNNKKQKSKDDDFVEEENTNVGKQLDKLNKQAPKMGLFKKSQSLNVD